MKNGIFKSTLVTLALFALGCAPEIKHIAPPRTKPLLGPKQADVSLRFNGNPNLYEKLPSFSEQIFATGDVLNTVENLLRLSYQLNLPQMTKLAYQIQGHLYNNAENVKSVGFERSPYVDAVLNESRPMVKGELDSILKLISDQSKLISLLLDSRTLPAPANARYPLIAFSDMSKERLINELNFLRDNGIEPIIIDAIEQVFAKEVFPKLESAKPYIKALLEAKTLERTLGSLDDMFSVFQYTPTKELSEKITLGYQIAHSISTMRSEQAALSLIVKFWRMMTPKERLDNFKPSSKDLYEYLYERNERDLTCLASDSCLDLVIFVAKKKIFAGLRDYGLAELQQTFNNGAHEFVIEQIERTTPGELAVIPQEMKKKILPQMQAKADEITQIRDDFETYLRTVLLGWAKQNIYTQQSQSLPLLEKNQVRLSLNNGKPAVSAAPNSDSNFHFQTVGSSFALTSIRWNATDFRLLSHDRNTLLMRQMIEQINKLLLAYDQRPTENQPPVKKQFDAFATGELIRGLSLISYHLRDYETTVFDSHLGRVQIGDLDIDSLPTEIAHRPLFPKDTMYALAVGNAGLLLKALNSSPSPVFTVDTDNKIQWLDRAVDDPKSPNVMAGVVDIINGKRSQLVRSLSLSKFLTSLTEFYQATEKLEQTKASRLLEKNPEGKTHLEVLLESRTDIRNLIIGLSNFLSHQIKNEDGATLHSIHINETVVKSKDTLYLDDQISSIEALLDSYQLLKTKIYLWSAIDTYYALNRAMWNPEIDFYNADTKQTSVNFPQRIAALHAIARLKEFLPNSSKEQAERILQINTKAFDRD